MCEMCDCHERRGWWAVAALSLLIIMAIVGRFVAWHLSLFLFPIGLFALLMACYWDEQWTRLRNERERERSQGER